MRVSFEKKDKFFLVDFVDLHGIVTIKYGPAGTKTINKRALVST